MTHVQRELVKSGAYEVLSSGAYRKKLDQVTQQCGKKEAKKVRAAVLYDYLLDQAHFIENHPDEAYRDPISYLSKIELESNEGLTDYATAHMFRVFDQIARYQVTLDSRYLYHIESSPLITASDELLRLRTGEGMGDSTIQQGRMFLLAIRGL